MPLTNTGDGTLQLLLLQGRDIGEPVTQHGPFVGNTQQEPLPLPLPLPLEGLDRGGEAVDRVEI